MKNKFSFIVLITLLSGCSTNSSSMEYNEAASADLTKTIGFDPLSQTVLNSYINPSQHTMSTLYGNPIAAEYARRQSGATYPDGATLTLVTWQQQADPRWFGGNIPGNISSVEVVSFDSSGTPAYLYYTGTPLTATRSPQPPQERTNWISHEKISVIP